MILSNTAGCIELLLEFTESECCSDSVECSSDFWIAVWPARGGKSVQLRFCFTQVEHNEQLVSASDLLRTVEDAGFDGKVISVVHKAGNQVGIDHCSSIG